MRKYLFTALCLLLCLAFCSCGLIIINENPGKPGAETTDNTQPGSDEITTEEGAAPPADDEKSLKAQSDALFNALSVATMGGVRFVVATVDDTFLIGDGSETQLSSQRISRIARIEEKLQTEISIKSYTTQELYNQASASYNSGDYFADLLAIPQTLTGIMASDGILYNMRSVPNFKLDAEYFDQNAICAMTAGHAVYGVSGDGCFEPEKITGLFFNRTLANELELDPYALVASGEWTLDRYAEYDAAAKAAEKTPAVNGTDKNYALALLYGSGFDFTSNKTDATPTANTFTEDFEKLISVFLKIDGADISGAAMESFAEGDALFCAAPLTSASSISDLPLSWGLIPMPKLTVEDGYSAYISDDAVVLCILNGTDDKESSGDFIEALCAVSYGYIEYGFIKYNMVSVLRDNTSVNNMKRITDGVNYDFVNIMTTGFPTLAENTITAFENAASGTLTYDEYEERRDDVSEYLDKWFPVKYK